MKDLKEIGVAIAIMAVIALFSFGSLTVTPFSILLGCGLVALVWLVARVFQAIID